MTRYISTVIYILFVIVGSAAFLSIAGIRVGLIAPLSGFLMIKTTVIAAFFLCFLSVLGYFLNKNKQEFEVKRFYLLCFLVSFIYSVLWLSFHYQRSQLPKINDIVTNVDRPLMYIRVADLRHTDDNDVAYSDGFAVQQQKYYPEITSLYLDEKSDEVFKKVLELVQAKSWDVVSLYPSEGVVEATATTPVFWFMDDVVIRVKSTEKGTRVDMRSSSRIGRGDYGTNARRVKIFLKKLEDSVKFP